MLLNKEIHLNLFLLLSIAVVLAGTCEILLLYFNYLRLFIH